MTDPLVAVLALTPLPGARRTLGQGLTGEQLEALAAAARQAIAAPVLALHRPCCTPEPCEKPWEHRPGTDEPVCVVCVDVDMQTFAYPCPTLLALGVSS